MIVFYLIAYSHTNMTHVWVANVALFEPGSQTFAFQYCPSLTASKVMCIFSGVLFSVLQLSAYEALAKLREAVPIRRFRKTEPGNLPAERASKSCCAVTHRHQYS